MINTTTEKIIADTIAAEIHLTSVVVMQSSDTVSLELSTFPETIVSSGERGPAGVSEEEMVYAKRTDFISDSLLYRGEAIVGSLNSSPLWRIRRITIDTDDDITEEWAGGDAQFNNIWDNRLSLSYS